MTDVRKIAENITNYRFPEQQIIAILLNVVVEERRKVLDLRHELEQGKKCLVDHYLKALHELNLEGVWPGKEG